MSKYLTEDKPTPEQFRCPHCEKMRVFSHQARCERNEKNLSAKSDSGILFEMFSQLQQKVAMMVRKPLTFEEVKNQIKKSPGQLKSWIFYTNKGKQQERNSGIRDIINIYNTLR